MYGRDMPKKYGITFRFLGDIVLKRGDTVKRYFSRKGWTIESPEHVREYLIKNL